MLWTQRAKVKQVLQHDPICLRKQREAMGCQRSMLAGMVAGSGRSTAHDSGVPSFGSHA